MMSALAVIAGTARSGMLAGTYLAEPGRHSAGWHSPFASTIKIISRSIEIFPRWLTLSEWNAMV